MKYRNLNNHFKAEQHRFYQKANRYDKLKHQQLEKMAINGIHPFRPF